MAQKGITVIIPCLNEEQSIGESVDRALRGIELSGEKGEVIVVDNGSTDRSVEIARGHGAHIYHEEHRGYGAALRQGFGNAHYDIAVMGDADLTYDFTQLRDLTAPIRAGDADFVIGNRMRNIQPGAMPWLHQYIGNPLLSLMLRLMFHNHSVKDAHCGLRAISLEAYHSMRCVTTGMEFASEMVIRAIRGKLRIEERDIIYHPRAGDSKLRSFRDGWRHLRFMMLHSPSSMMILPGLIGWLIGFAIIIPLAFGQITLSERVIDIHSMIVGGIINVISIQLILVGLLAKAYAHLSDLHHDPLIAWFYRRFTFEKSIAYITPFILLGLALTFWVVLRWMGGGFGPLNQSRLLFLGLIFLVNGVQLGSSAYLFSIMALPRFIDALPPSEEDRGVAKKSGE
ncbi:MAG: glycosyltransferase family 2 protein [Kiritimatiellae bacterium]|nr:glycosyltransferase family 2 protein [Kiritimatiellia bacterium]